MRHIYIGQFGVCFRLTLDQWRRLCEGGAAGEGYDLSHFDAKELRRFPPGVVKEIRDSDQRSSVRSDLLYYEPLDWYDYDFRDHLEELDERLREADISAASAETG